MRGGIAFSDTDFAGCRVSRKSTSGGCLLINGHLVKHWSSTQKVIALSSGEAELAGVVKAACESLGLRSLCRDLGMELSLHIYADSTAAIGICQRSGVGRVRHIDVAQLWVQQKLKRKKFLLSKCLGADNPADILTKHTARALLEGLLPRIAVRSEAGRAASAPELIRAQAFRSTVCECSDHLLFLYKPSHGWHGLRRSVGDCASYLQYAEVLP